MNNNNKITKGAYRLFIIAVLTFTFNIGYSQSISDLEKQIEASKRSIEKANLMLTSNDSTQMSNMQKLTLIKSQISNRQSIINNMKSKSRIIQKNINVNLHTIDKLKTEEDKLKKEYSNYMTISYKNYLFNNSLLFIFSAKDFNDLQMRIYYLKRYSQMRYEMAVDMDKKAKDVKSQNDSLAVKRKEYDKIVGQTQDEVTKLNKENKLYNDKLSSLKNERTKLFKEIKNNQDQIKKVQKRISDLVAEEARRQKELANKASAADKAKNSKESSEFAAMKGHLPHPTSKGIITERFGTHPHPVHTTLMVQNKGLNYEVPKGSDITTVFNGVVTKVFFFQGTNNSVMVRHGAYITTYTGLTEVNVKSGDIVRKGQKLGSMNKGGTLHFELWKGTDYFNPESWLSK